MIVLAALAGAVWLREAPPRALGFALAIGVLLVPLGITDRPVVGTEGVLDMATPGLLLALGHAALRARARLLALACLVVAGEELDWGQRLWFFPTPAALGAVPSRSTDLNLHNIDGLDVLWQPLPLLLLVASAWRAHLPARLAGALLRVGVPAVVPATAPVLLVLGAGSLALGVSLGQRPADEAFELATVWALLVGWERGRAGAEGLTRPGAPGPATPAGAGPADA